MWKAICQIEEYKTNPLKWSLHYSFMHVVTNCKPSFKSSPLLLPSRATLVQAPMISNLSYFHNLSAPFLPSTLLALKFIILTVHQVIFLKNNIEPIINPPKILQ